MAVQIIEMEHFESESKALGASSENLKAARTLVQAALDERDDIVSYQYIRSTTGDPDYRPWIRIRGKKSGIRIAIELYQENEDNIVLLHAVAPRDEHTYDEFERLWQKYRSRV